MRIRGIDLRRIRTGDQEAFKKLFESFYVPLREFVVGFLPPPSDVAADIAQETLVKFWQRRENFDSMPQVKSFLYNTARNAVLNELAHRRVVDSYNQKQVEQDSSRSDKRSDWEYYAPDHREIRSELIRQLRDEISALPRRTRQIMEMALQGNRNDEIAAILDIERETVRSLKKSAHKKLRVRLYRYKWLLDDYNDEIFS